MSIICKREFDKLLILKRQEKYIKIKLENLGDRKVLSFSKFAFAWTWNIFLFPVFLTGTLPYSKTTRYTTHNWFPWRNWPLYTLLGLLNYSACVCVSCLVVSDSLWPHGLYPTKLLCPWNSPGKNTGVGCHALLWGIFPTQGSNPGLLHWRQFFYHVSQQGRSS